MFQKYILFYLATFCIIMKTDTQTNKMFVLQIQVKKKIYSAKIWGRDSGSSISVDGPALVTYSLSRGNWLCFLCFLSLKYGVFFDMHLELLW